MDERKQKRIDEVLAFLLKAPRSFTGEDVLEIHCHGGLIAVQQVLDLVLACPGVRRALPGEFSQRAVLNGRINLTQAEAINELIAARSRKAAHLAMTGMDGGIQKRITELREILLDQLSELEARVDFEDELPALDAKTLLEEILKVRLALQKLVDDANRCACIRNGINVAIVGCPNVGKSSLLNRLSRYEKAIVTDLPGTTRDLLESDIVLEGVPLTLIDTAGIRATNNKVERLGISKSHQALSGADVILLVFDLSVGWTKNDESLLAQVPAETPKILVGNKSDISKLTSLHSHVKTINPHVTFSALTGSGEEKLITTLLQKSGTSGTQSIAIALNERQRDLASKAADSLTKVQEVAKRKLPWDFWTIDLRQAIHHLGEITGEEITENILDRIFARFCIGK